MGRVRVAGKGGAGYSTVTVGFGGVEGGPVVVGSRELPEADDLEEGVDVVGLDGIPALRDHLPRWGGTTAVGWRVG